MKQAVTFDSKEGSPTLVMIHGYAASQGFFFRNFDFLADHFKVIAIDQLGWGKRWLLQEWNIPKHLLLKEFELIVPQLSVSVQSLHRHNTMSHSQRLVHRFTFNNLRGLTLPAKVLKHIILIPDRNAETEAWFVDSLEEWRKSKNLNNFILLGHSFGGYVAAKYALKHPEHIKQLILVGSAGFSSESDQKSERLTLFRATWKGAILNHLWESNFTPQKVIRGLGPWGPDLVRRYTTARFGAYSTGDILTEEESKLLTDYVYHTLAAKASGEMCLKYIFSFGAFARSPLLRSASEWKVPTSFIYGFEDWMNYQGAQEARKNVNVQCDIVRVPQGGHFVLLDNPSGFHSAVLYACRRFLSPDPDNYPFPEDLTFA